MTSLLDLFSFLFESFSDEDWEGLGVVLILLAAWGGLPVYFLIKSRKMARLVLLMRCLPTSKVRGVFIGLAEVKGAARRTPPLYSYLAEKECVWYSYTIEEHWRKVETETYRDSKGNVRTRTVVRTGWTTVAEDASTDDFLLQDDTGSIRVWPDGATVEASTLMDRTCGTGDPLYYGKGPAGAIPYSTFRRRFRENGIPLGVPLYIIGTTREQEDAIHPEFAEADNGDPYFISTNDEESITRSKSFYAKLLPLIGGIILIIPSFLENYDFPYNFYNPDFGFWGQSIWLHATIIYAVYWMVWTFWQWYGEMVAARNRVKQGAAQVEVQLQRRHDLIRQLQDVVEAYCHHEQGLLEQVGRLRGTVGQGQISMLAEAYPALKANTLFAKLQQELTDTEERLALAREYLNTIGNYYNTRLQVFPGGLILKLLRFPTFHNYE